MMEATWMLYGANGYTGQLIAKEAVRRGQRPILAGRNADAVRALAKRLDLPFRAFPLQSSEVVRNHIADVRAVLLAAGPFSHTSQIVVNACIEKGIHYLDITGEIRVLEACYALHQVARTRGSIVLPGIGFDVVPSDCLAATLKEKLPDANHLEIGLRVRGDASRGTTLATIEGLAWGGAVRKRGIIVPIPHASRSKMIPFRDRSLYAVAIPWGDIASAYRSTGIDNIEVYLSMPRIVGFIFRCLRPILPWLTRPPLASIVRTWVARRPAGPSAHMRQSSTCELWGRVSNATNDFVEARLTTPEPYHLTAKTAVECVQRVLLGLASPGVLTPAMAFGPQLILEFEGCELQITSDPNAIETGESERRGPSFPHARS